MSDIILSMHAVSLICKWER